MILFKKTSIDTVVFFLILFLISIKTYSQEQEKNSISRKKCNLDSFVYSVKNPALITYHDTVIVSSLFLPLILDEKLLFPKIQLTPKNPMLEPSIAPITIAKHKLFADVYNKNAIHLSAYKYLIENNMKNVKYTAADFYGTIETIEPMHSNVFQHIFKIDSDIDNDNAAKPDRFHPKRRYWVYSGNHSTQLSQNYSSDNWYKGGVKNFNLLNTHKVSFNYSKNKFQSNHDIEWRLNLFTNPNDTVRNYRIGDDVIRTYSDFGIQAFNKWFYSSNIEIKTQVLKKFAENTNNLLSAAFAPLYINVGFLGMKYQLEKSFPNVKGKKITFNTDISPLSIQYITVLNKEIDPARFGIEEGSKHLTNFGSKVTANLKFDINKNVSYVSRFDYFTNYEKVTAEWENTLNMPINRYFSVKLFLFFRYDDNKNLVSDKTLGYYQVSELLSFGFNYRW